jgi:hypothetical protein
MTATAELEEAKLSTWYLAEILEVINDLRYERMNIKLWSSTPITGHSLEHYVCYKVMLRSWSEA